MSFLSDIFNPTLLIFLGITLLIIALLIVYFEGKMREQNHKISSMLSLVSSLAEETNMIKFHLNHANINLYQAQNNSLSNNIPFTQGINLEEKLIPVSDDEDDEDEDDDDEDDDEDHEDEDDDDDDDSDDEDDEDDDEDEHEDDDIGKNITINELLNENDIKVLNLDNLNNTINEKYGNDEQDDDDDDEDHDDDDEDNNDLEDIDFNKLSDNEDENENIVDLTDNLKSINIISNLEQHNETKNKNVEVIDYKKLSMNKLKSIVLEKGLVSDSSKLKKQDLLKLLNVE
jgi:hypothetical protein